jgi:hypothetical protein
MPVILALVAIGNFAGASGNQPQRHIRHEVEAATDLVQMDHTGDKPCKVMPPRIKLAARLLLTHILTWTIAPRSLTFLSGRVGAFTTIL